MQTTKSPSHSMKRYDSINFLRGFSAIGVMFCHIIANIQPKPDFPFILSSNIGKMAWLTMLFLTISGFSMCCGYYNRFKQNNVNLNAFYKKRFMRIWPIFALVVFLELLYNPSIISLKEALADLSLSFALYPNPDISVCGVGWFIGVIFVFYMIFPYFVFLLWNKKRAWIVLGTTIVLHYIGVSHFYDTSFVSATFVPKYNFIFCIPFLFLGGLLFLYKELIVKIKKYTL